MRRYFSLIAVLLLAITSCAPSRGEADKKLASACLNSVKTLSDPSDKIEVRKKAFKTSKKEEGITLRIVTLDVDFTRGQELTAEKTYVCSYEEQWSLFGYIPSFYNMEKDGNKYGNFDGKAVGDVSDLMKITVEMEKELY